MGSEVPEQYNPNSSAAAENLFISVSIRMKMRHTDTWSNKQRDDTENIENTC